MIAPFRAFVVNQAADGFQMGIRQLEQRDLPPGDVLIQVAYAAVNYKDALVCIPNGRVARTYPLVPGLELTGAVVESTDPRFQPGDAVLAYDFGSTQGISRHGGYSEYARVPGDFLFLEDIPSVTQAMLGGRREGASWSDRANNEHGGMLTDDEIEQAFTLLPCATVARMQTVGHPLHVQVITRDALMIWRCYSLCLLPQLH